MNVSRTIAPSGLIVVAILASAYAFFVDRKSVSDADRAERKNDVFPSFRIDEVRRIQLVHGPETLVLERTADLREPWRMTSPRVERADPAIVDVLTRELEMATRVRDVPPDEASGLDAPRVAGRIAAGETEYRFRLGDDARWPDGAAYMRLDGEGTFVVARSLTVQLLRGADAYRDRVLVRYGEGEVAHLELSDDRGAWALERVGGAFRLGGARGLRASRAAVDRLFEALAEVRAAAFLDGPADAAVPAPAVSIEIVPADASRPRVRLAIGGPCQGDPNRVVARREEPEPMSACVDKTPAALLAVPHDDAVDKSLLYARPDEIEDVRLEPLEGDGPRVDIARRGVGWHERAPEDRELTADEADSAGGLVAALANARAIDVRPPGKDEVHARFRVTVVRTGLGTTEVVDVTARNADGTATAQRKDDGAILRLSSRVASRFEPHPIALRAPSVWPSPLEAASVVAVDDSCGPARWAAEMRAGVWRTRDGKGVDASSVNDLVAALASARADSWVSEDDDGAFGLSGATSCTVALTVSTRDGGAGRWGIVFGADGEGGTYARTLASPAVFVVKAAYRKTAEEEPHR